MPDIANFLATKEGMSAVLSAGSTISASIFVYILQGKPKLIWYSPNSTRFDLKNEENPDQPLIVNAGQIFVENIGRNSASQVQITSVKGFPPAGYVVAPNIVHSARMSEAGEWIVEIPYIAPGESIGIQILNGPLISSVRSKEGLAKYVPVVHQKFVPSWMQKTAASLAVVGILTIFYFFWKVMISFL